MFLPKIEKQETPAVPGRNLGCHPLKDTMFLIVRRGEISTTLKIFYICIYIYIYTDLDIYL